MQRFVHVRCARTAHRLCERTIPHDVGDNEPRAPVVLADDNLGQRRTVHFLVGDALTFGAQQRAVDQVEWRVEEPSKNRKRRPTVTLLRWKGMEHPTERSECLQGQSTAARP